MSSIVPHLTALFLESLAVMLCLLATEDANLPSWPELFPTIARGIEVQSLELRRGLLCRKLDVVVDCRGPQIDSLS